MRRQSRKWFDGTYELTQGFLPFGVFTGPIDLKMLRNVSGPAFPDEMLVELLKKINSFSKKIPSKREFEEEKERLYPKLAKDLRDVFPYAHTGISFGGVVGDIDIGMITNRRLKETEVLDGFYAHKELVKKYPMLDWHTLPDFCCRGGYNLSSRIADSRFRTTGKKLDFKEQIYVMETVLHAKVLWGDKGELVEMKRYFGQDLRRYLQARK